MPEGFLVVERISNSCALVALSFLLVAAIVALLAIAICSTDNYSATTWLCYTFALLALGALGGLWYNNYGRELYKVVPTEQADMIQLVEDWRIIDQQGSLLTIERRN